MKREIELSDLLQIPAWGHQLRVGNYYAYLHEESESFSKADIDFIKTQLEYDEDPDADQFSRGWWAVPVPITENILEKCGFNFGVNENATYYINLNGIDQQLDIIISTDGFYPRIVQAPEMSCEDPQVIGLNKIEYLHTLQNLYFLLTGTELIIEPIKSI